MLYKNKLYNGTETILFDEFKHQYSDKHGPILSVTQILNTIAKPALVNWAARMAVESISEKIIVGKKYDELQLQAIFEEGKEAHWEKRKYAASRGTLIHNWIEKYIKGQKPDIPVSEDLKDSIRQFLEWEKSHRIEFLLSEQIVYSKKYRIVGTGDFICNMKNCPKPGLYLGDLKTGSGVRPENWLQNAIYTYCRMEEFPEEKYQGQLIVRMDKKGMLEFAVNRDIEIYKKMVVGFLACKRLAETMILVNNFKPERQ